VSNKSGHGTPRKIGTAPSEMATESSANTSPGKAGRPDEGRGNSVTRGGSTRTSLRGLS